MRWLYLCLALLGAALPYSQLLPWLAQHGLNVTLLFTQLFSTRVGAFFGLDVLLSAAALLAFILTEGKRRKVGILWLPIRENVNLAATPNHWSGRGGVGAGLAAVAGSVGSRHGGGFLGGPFRFLVKLLAPRPLLAFDR